VNQVMGPDCRAEKMAGSAGFTAGIIEPEGNACLGFGKQADSLTRVIFFWAFVHHKTLHRKQKFNNKKQNIKNKSLKNVK